MPNPPNRKQTELPLRGEAGLARLFFGFPFAILYDGITRLRNWLYDKGLLRSHAFATPTIVVGNLTVGGTGKTPHVEYLIGLLKGTHAITTLSRGYGRRTKGFRVADGQSDARQIGDEPLQMYRKFGDEISVAVGEDRVAAIGKIIRNPEFGILNSQNSIPGNRQPPPPSEGAGGRLPRIIILDDAFQHRPVRAAFSLLLTDYNRLFYNDFVLPAGNLRESRTGASRAGCIIVSKCPPELVLAESQAIADRIGEYAAPGTPVFFTAIRYGNPVGFGFLKDTILSGKVMLVSGIARPETLESHASGQFELQRHLVFADHHDYTLADVEKICRVGGETGAKNILTTEKDFVKLARMRLPPEMSFFYLPIEIYFLFGGEKQFQRMLGNGIR